MPKNRKQKETVKLKSSKKNPEDEEPTIHLANGCKCGCVCHEVPIAGYPIQVLADHCKARKWEQPEYSTV